MSRHDLTDREANAIGPVLLGKAVEEIACYPEN